MTSAGAPRRTVLRGGLVVDGSGAEPFEADVEIVGDRIGRIGDLSAGGAGGEAGAAGAAGDTSALGEATDVVDVDGLVVCPGFIDIHTHFDAQIFWDPDLSPSGAHGVTSVVVGNCGFGIAPTRRDDRAAVMETLEHVEGMSLATLAEGIEWGFETFPEYLAAVGALPRRLNFGAYLGHTPLRIFVMGFEAATSRAASDAEIDAMRELLRDALSHGAMGISTSRAPNHIGAAGLPVPSRVAARDELVALFAVLAESGRGIAGMTFGPDLDLDAVTRLSAEMGFRATWGSLLTGMFGPSGTAFRMLEEAASHGGSVWPQVSCRSIVLQISLEDPYFLGQVPAFRDVFAVDRPARRGVYEDEAWRARARGEIEQYRAGFYRKTSVEETERHLTIVGRSLEDLAAERGIHPLDVMVDLALAEDLRTRFRVVVHNDDPVELPRLLRDRRTLLGVHDAGAHVDMLCDAGYPTHLLGHWVRDESELGLAEAVWKLTGQPAEVFGIAGRGRVATGLQADLVAFDPAAVAALPSRRVWDFPAGGERLVSDSRGVEAVFVNGVRTFESGKPVAGAYPGSMLSPAALR